MALNSTIGGSGALFVGEDKKFRLAVKTPLGVPVDITGWAIWFYVRNKDSSPDPPIFSKLASVTGAYNSDPLINTQRAEVVLTDTEMNTVTQKVYRYSWKRMDDDSETVLAYGDFTVERATAR